MPPDLVRSCFKPRLLTLRIWTRKMVLKPTAAFGIVKGEFSIVICVVLSEFHPVFKEWVILCFLLKENFLFHHIFKLCLYISF